MTVGTATVCWVFARICGSIRPNLVVGVHAERSSEEGRRMVLVAGVMMVRDEVDVIRANILHHHSQGIRHLLVVDDGSTDGTFEELEELEREGLIRLYHHSGGFAQAAWTNRLLHQARIEGAQWIVPLDADEFWLVPGGRIDTVLEATEEDGLRVAPINMVQHRSQQVATPAGLLRILHRPMVHFTHPGLTQSAVATNQIAHCEVRGVAKWIFRPTPERYVDTGSHSLTSSPANSRVTDEIICLHAAIRSRNRLHTKMTDAYERRRDAGRFVGNASWHIRRWGELLAAGGEAAIDREWAANSVDDHGVLDIYGTPRQLQWDPVFYDTLRRPVLQTVGIHEADMLIS